MRKTDQKQQKSNWKFQHIYDPTTWSWQRQFLKFQTIITNLQIKANKRKDGESKADHNIATDVCNLKGQWNYVEVTHNVQNMSSIHCATRQQLNNCIWIHITTKYESHSHLVHHSSKVYVSCCLMLLTQDLNIETPVLFGHCRKSTSLIALCYRSCLIYQQSSNELYTRIRTWFLNSVHCMVFKKTVIQKLINFAKNSKHTNNHQCLRTVDPTIWLYLFGCHNGKKNQKSFIQASMTFTLNATEKEDDLHKYLANVVCVETSPILLQDVQNQFSQIIAAATNEFFCRNHDVTNQSATHSLRTSKPCWALKKREMTTSGFKSVNQSLNIADL